MNNRMKMPRRLRLDHGSKKAPQEASEELFDEQEDEDATQIEIEEGDHEDSDIEEDSQVIDSQPEQTRSPIVHPPKKRHYHQIGGRRGLVSAIVNRNRRDPLYFIPQRRGRGITTRLVGVVDWYRQNELLYNKKMRAYRDRDKKTQTWNTKAAQLGVDGEFIKLISNLNLILIQN